jgi:hypothetical protein
MSDFIFDNLKQELQVKKMDNKVKKKKRIPLHTGILFKKKGPRIKLPRAPPII